MTWLTFSGSSDQSGADFAQAIQRFAFQNHVDRDDEWVARYAATCFTGNALLWYSDLDQDTQSSWRKLRAAILRRYPPEPAVGIGPWELIAPPSSRSPSNRSSVMGSPSRVLRGYIEVATDDTGIVLGVLSLGILDHIAIRSQSREAIQVTFEPSPAARDPLRLRMAASEPHLGFFGISLVAPDQSTGRVPPELSGQRYPILSNVCNGPTNDMATEILATWALLECSEGPDGPGAETKFPRAVASSFVWRYETSTRELHLTWSSDGADSKLGAFVHKGSASCLHLHRLRDAAQCPHELTLEQRVRFYFQPMSS
ncbi:hypothetical protein M407DRAFT_118713 [Tulasnella calospora MUT 4182]|uniref:Uncharacterized protein n=1 Tax=Tulasnella calospora MUT 4182 TaxID=1051891 RepID=A0A0C3QSP8_9AGAM|nr:hypothetical protein M407DRAFT_118713 [Tulasnella calospora MUT 4182]